jgi:uncharacterized phiE125 gp8 family phage protein
MALTLVTGPATEPLTPDEVKAHLRVEVDDEDALIDGWIMAAREYVEQYTKRALMPQTWDLVLDSFTACDYSKCGVLWLPFPPVTSITSISYVDTAGTSQTWSASLYATELPVGPHARRATIQPVPYQYYPATRSQPNAVTVRFVCGYADAESVPWGIKAAMQLLIGDYYAQRNARIVGTIVSENPAVTALLFPFKAF